MNETTATLTTATALSFLEREVKRFTSRLRRDVTRGDYSPFSREAAWEEAIAQEELEAASRAASGTSFFWEVNCAWPEHTLSALIAEKAAHYKLWARVRNRTLTGSGQCRFHIKGRQRLDVALARFYRALCR